MPHSAFEDLRRTVEAALAVEDATAALAALRPVARAVAAEHGAEFRTLIANIPDAAWRADAEIASAMGASYRAAGSPRGSSAIGYFRAADAALAARNQDADPDRVRVWLGHAAALRSLGQLESAQRLGKRARTLDVPDGIHSIFSTHVGLGARCALEMGMLDLHLGDLDAARRKLEYANGLAAEHLIRAERIEVLGGLALIDFARSALETASRYIAQARALAAGTELWTTGYAAPALVAETLVAVERHDLEGAAEIESAMLDAAGNSDWEPFSYIAASYQRLASRQLAEGLDLLQRARDGFRGWSPAGVGLSLEELFRASLLVELDQGEEAWSILRDLPRYEHRVLCPAPITAQLRLGNGDLRGAGDALEECEQHPDNHSPRTIVEIQMLRAAIEFEKGEIRFADVMFDRALVTIARTGSRA
ncbi:MAG TPA: hypothetical protein VNS80_07490, partial [Pseudolysinimonas sp.]|nr:hypothetical protein [Pseudolysinimonas sp.]